MSDRNPTNLTSHVASAAASFAVLLALAAPAPALGAFSISDFEATPLSAAAGSHPDSTVYMEFGGDATDDVKDIIQHFPGGIIPNPEALPKCSAANFATGVCPLNSRLGSTTLTATPEIGLPVPVAVPGDVYNIEVDPPYVGGLGFVVAGTPLAAPFTVRSARHGITTSLPDVEADTDLQPIMPTARDYGLTGLSVDVPRELDLGLGVVPIKINSIEYTLDGTPPTATSPYLTTTTACLQGYPMLEATSWDQPDVRVSRVGAVLSGIDCDEGHLPYTPDPFDVALESTRTDSPTGFGVSINVPANEIPVHQPYLKRSSITLPEGMVLSPPAAQGLEGCTDAQLGIGTQQPPACPAGADIGDVTVQSKNVPALLHGDVYLGQPAPGHTYRLFMAFPIVAGLWVKLDGETTPDPQTGRLTTVFDDLPMLPFEKFTLSLKGGDHAVLVNPPDCGTHQVTSTLTPWSAANDFPPSRDKHPAGSFSASYDGQGAACPSEVPFEPAIAGSTTPAQAGASASMSLTLADPDRHQRLRTLRTSLPPGLVGRLTGISLCPIADAAAGTCATASRIGSVTTAVGAGGAPLALPGTMYLAKPLQRGDPASLSIVVPARAGPFDFGNVVIRARIALRRDAGLDVALVDDLPQIVGGIPIRVRTVTTTIDRAAFMLNPTSCAALSFSGTFTSLANAERTAAGGYRASGCGSLAFAPKLRFVVSGQTRKDGHPRLRAIVTQPAGQANIAASRVVLPDVIRPEVAALQRPGGLCPEAQLATRNCPAGSLVGTAQAVTPLLRERLSGPVYVVQHAANPLPKLTVFLDGLVSIQLDAQNELERLSIVNRFDALPDVPVKSFELAIRGGPNGILRNYADLCRARVRGQVSFKAHSGKATKSRPLVEAPACRPRASISLRGFSSGSPVLKLRVQRAPAAARLRELRLILPDSLTVALHAVRDGVVVRGARKFGRAHWSLDRHGVLRVRKLRRRGVSSIAVTLRRGVLKTRGTRRHTRAHLKFKLRVVDVQKRRFRITRSASVS